MVRAMSKLFSHLKMIGAKTIATYREGRESVVLHITYRHTRTGELYYASQPVRDLQHAKIVYKAYQRIYR